MVIHRTYRRGTMAARDWGRTGFEPISFGFAFWHPRRVSLSLWNRIYAAITRVFAQVSLGLGPLRRMLARRRVAAVDGRTLDEHTAAMLRLDDFAGRTGLQGVHPVRARLGMATDIRSAEAKPPAGVRTREDVYPSPAGPAPLRVYEPEGLDAPSPGVVLYHGGGWVTGSIDTHDSWCRTIAAGARVRVVSVEYRCAPEHPFPAALEDSVSAFRHVASEAESFGVDPRRLAVCGDSAGGNLSAVVSLRLRGEPLRPAVQALVYPAVDGTCSLPSVATLAHNYGLTRANLDWYYGHYVGTDTPRTHPDLSPLHADSVDGVPPAIIVTCGFDPLRDEGAAYADRLRAAGVQVLFREEPGLIHGFAFMGAFVPEARHAMDRFVQDLGQALGRG
jgi:acetyl esterase